MRKQKVGTQNKVFARCSQGRLASTLVVVGMLLSACNFIPPTEQPLTRTLVKPTISETVPATETPVIDETPWVELTPTETATETATETVAPTADETAVSYKESRYYEPGFKLEMEGSVEGVTVPFKVGLHPSIMNRESEPIVSVEINRPDTADVYAKFWMTMCWKKYEEQHPEAAGISFFQYMQLVKDGGGEIEIAAVDEATEDQNNKLLTFEPEKGFVYIATAEKYFLPETISFGDEGMYFGKNKNGQLIVVYRNMSSVQIEEKRSFDGTDGWTAEALFGLGFSVKFAQSLELVLSTNNKDLISSTRYYQLTDFSFIDSDLYLRPQLQSMWDSKNPFFLIGQ